MEDFEKIFSKIETLKVAVIGDIMLDTYLWGKVERISPEAPVPVVAVNKKDYRLGGAANVALNTASLKAGTTVFSIIGDDADAALLISLLEKEKIDSQYIIKSKERITTNKTRIISRNQQMMRLDAEITNDIPGSDEDLLIEKFNSYINTSKPDVVIFEDYNKGVLTESLIQKAITVCKQHDIITAVDPKRKNFFSYKSVDIFKPNLKEVKDGLNITVEELKEELLENIHRQLHDVLQHNISLITLSEHGLFIGTRQASQIIPSHVRNITDVSGAGDTVIAVASLVYAATKNVVLAAAIANLAGGLVCEEVGTVAINPEKLLAGCKAAL